MKIIDLLNKIANGEEAPKKIKYSNYIFKYTGDRRIQRLYVMENQENYLLRDFVASLNSEIEILEEEKKIPEKLLYREDYATQNACIDDIIRQFNYLLDYLKSKGE